MTDSKHPKSVKHSVAVLVRQNDNILTVRRPDEEEDLPGIWGLPAGSYREGETLNDLVQRIGRDKLGVELQPIRTLARGRQERAEYVLEMELVEGRMDGVPTPPEWLWGLPDALREGQRQGSLCCDLVLGLLVPPGEQ